MKRTHIINLNSEIDPKTRLEVYKEALRDMTLIHKYGLCIGLPMVLWNLESYHDKAPNGLDWSYGKTGLAFPEVTNEIINRLAQLERSSDRGNSERTEIIKEFIEELESSN